MDAPSPLTCRELVRLITEYLDGAMDPRERLAFERHVATCHPCRGYLAQMQSVLRATGRLGEESLTPEAERTLLAAFRDWKADAGR